MTENLKNPDLIIYLPSAKSIYNGVCDANTRRQKESIANIYGSTSEHDAIVVSIKFFNELREKIRDEIREIAERAIDELYVPEGSISSVIWLSHQFETLDTLHELQAYQSLEQMLTAFGYEVTVEQVSSERYPGKYTLRLTIDWSNASETQSPTTKELLPAHELSEHLRIAEEIKRADAQQSGQSFP